MDFLGLQQAKEAQHSHKNAETIGHEITISDPSHFFNLMSEKMWSGITVLNAQAKSSS